MSDASGRQRLGTRWVDRSMRTKGLVVIAVPIAILFVVLGSTFWFTHVDNRAQDVAQPLPTRSWMSPPPSRTACCRRRAGSAATSSRATRRSRPRPPGPSTACRASSASSRR